MWLWISTRSKQSTDDTRHCDIKCHLGVVLAVCFSVQRPIVTDYIIKCLWHPAELIQVPIHALYVLHMTWHSLLMGINDFATAEKRYCIGKKKKKKGAWAILSSLHFDQVWQNKKLCTRPAWSTARHTCCAEPPLPWHCTLQMPLRHQRAGHHRENRTWPHLQGSTTDASNFRHVRTLRGRAHHLRNHLQLGVSSYTNTTHRSNC